MTPYCNVVGVQGGGRLVAAAARGAEEDGQPHPRDEHLQLFKVGSAGSLSGMMCIHAHRQSLHQAKEKIRDLEKDNVILRCVLTD